MESIKINIPDYIKKTFNIILSKYSNAKLYIVGGCVRDSLLGLTPHDYDITTNLTPEEIMSSFDKEKIYNNNGLKHGTVSVIVDHNPVEITTFRSEGSYLDGRRPSNVSFTTSLSEDLKRRDFTINAMAYNEDEGLIDLYNGINDLKNGIVRCVGDPYIRFNEDYLRILRALRFSSKLNYKIEDITHNAILDTYKNLNIISKERIIKELEGILIGSGVEDILKTYKDVIFYIIPELKKIDGFIQNNKYHKNQDLYIHTINVVKNTKADFTTRFASLLHDIGKPDTYTYEVIDGKINGHFYNHALYSEKIAKNILKRLRVSLKDKEEILYLIKNHDIILNNTKSVKRLLTNTPNHSIDLLEKLMDLRNSDRLDHVNTKKMDNLESSEVLSIARCIIENNEALKITDLNITGDDLLDLGIEKGPLIGLILNKLLEKVLNDELSNEKEELLNEVRTIVNSTIIK